MTKRDRFILGMGHFTGAGVVGFGAMHASLNGHPVWALVLGGLGIGVWMLGILWMEGEI